MDDRVQGLGGMSTQRSCLSKIGKIRAPCRLEREPLEAYFVIFPTPLKATVACRHLAMLLYLFGPNFSVCKNLPLSCLAR